MLLSYLRPYRGPLVAACGALILSSLLSLVFSLLRGQHDGCRHAGVNRARSRLAAAQINMVALIMLGVLVVQAASSYFHSTTMTRVGQSALADLRRDTYGRLICLPMSFFASRRVGELNSRLSADLTQIEATLIMAVPQFPAAIPVAAGRHHPDRRHLGPADAHHARRDPAGIVAGGGVRTQAAPEFPRRPRTSSPRPASSWRKRCKASST